MQYFAKNGKVYLGYRDDSKDNGFVIEGHFYEYRQLSEYGFKPITSVQVEMLKHE